MAETLVDIHSIVRWAVLAALLAAVVYGFTRASGGASWTSKAGRPFTWSLMLIDIQVLIGVIVWISRKGWELGAFRAWIHPVGMLVALGVGHALVGRAGKAEGAGAYRLAAFGLLAALVIVAVSIPRDAWF